MSNHIDGVRPVILRGEDAEALARRLRHPTREEIGRNRANQEKIDRTIKNFIETKDGFSVTVDGLTLP